MVRSFIHAKSWRGDVKTAYSDDLSNYLLASAKNRKAVRYMGSRIYALSPSEMDFVLASRFQNVHIEEVSKRDERTY
jgi:hypothetical protein